MTLRTRTPIASFLPLALLAASCASPPEVPSGRGLVGVDPEAPADAAVFQKPGLQVGDRLMYRRGGKLRIELLVVEQEGGGLALEDMDSGITTLLGADLEQTGQVVPAEASLNTSLLPGDHQYAFPLWVGKRWTTHYVRSSEQGAIPILASYEVEAEETVDTPAGRFSCLRVWRRSRPAIDGEFLDRVTVSWYAPEVGWFVRKLEGDTITELEEFHRQR